MSKLIRRTHMYLALFLTPWVLLYALSTMAMNHRLGQHGGPPAWNLERELSYEGSFPPEASARQQARQLLDSLGLDGAHGVGRPRADGSFVITRFDPMAPRRVTYRPADGKVVIERQAFRSGAFLERMHRRRGFVHDYALEDAWAFSVDLVIATMCFWVLSGLWMWWEMKTTRRLGTLCLLGGALLFGLFVVTI